MDEIWLFTARTSGLMAAAAAISAVGVAVLFLKPLHDRLPVSLRLRLPTLIRIFATIAAVSVVIRSLAFWAEPTLRLTVRDLTQPTTDPGSTSAGSLAVIIMAATVAVILIGTALATYRTSSGEDSEGRFDSPTAILEEMRRRLEDLPTLPEFDTPEVDEPEVDLHDAQESRFENHEVANPFGESAPPMSSVASPLPERIPAEPAEPSGPPPLPTDAVDPMTGEPDEAAYTAWLKEWLVYAGQYGDETSDDPVRSVH